ncbi:hypothetical protein FG379_003011 [Cryptosporidium bovis]|uniref:uncharacterized protein n=1 Tax=Cryptosporidium bovis TaxID=310047 RepID=UPI00351A403B|nr:hypothetical protein FG379_003011 [Cryptosporidium bovis]
MRSIINVIIIHSLILFSFGTGVVFSSRNARNIITRIQSGISKNKISNRKELDSGTKSDACKIKVCLNENHLKSINYIRRYQLLGDDDRSKISELSAKSMKERCILSFSGLTYSIPQKTECSWKDVYLKQKRSIPLCERLLLQGTQLSIRASIKQSDNSYSAGININKYVISTRNTINLQDIMKEYINNVKTAKSPAITETGALRKISDVTVKSEKKEPIFDPVNAIIEKISAEMKQKSALEQAMISVPVPPTNRIYTFDGESHSETRNVKDLFSHNIPDIQGAPGTEPFHKKMLREPRRLPPGSEDEMRRYVASKVRITHSSDSKRNT